MRGGRVVDGKIRRKGEWGCEKKEKEIWSGKWVDGQGDRDGGRVAVQGDKEGDSVVCEETRRVGRVPYGESERTEKHEQKLREDLWMKKQ